MNNEIMVQLDTALNIDREFKVIPDSLGHKYALEATDVVYVDGKRFRMVERKAKVDEKVILVNPAFEYCQMSTGDIFEVTEVDEFEHYEGENSHIVSLKDTEFRMYRSEYRVLEPFDQAPESIVDIIANLIRRVASLESQLRDTQNNVERQGVEIANVKHLAESNEEDIRTLDERTQPIKSSVKIYDFSLTNYRDGRVNVDVSFVGKPTMENIAKAIAEVIGE